MMGISCTAAPFRVEENGHCRVTYGNHRQIRAAPDVLYFPYRLNGADMFTLFQTSYSRWGLNLLDYSMNPNDPYSKRLGDESFKRSIEGRRPLGPEAGGLRSYFLGLYESFVPYPSADSAQRNIGDSTMATIFHRGYVPQHLKYTFNCDLDAAYDVASLFGWSNSIYLSVYASFNGITTKRQIIALDKNSDATLLWGALARFEGAAATSSSLNQRSGSNPSLNSME